MNRKLMCALLGMVAACSFLSDAAVDLATCIREGVGDLSSSNVTTSQVTCPVRSERTVTVILTPTRELSETDFLALKQMGVPEDAIYYNGSDFSSIGQRVLELGSVNVYDAHFADNRKYSNSSALGSETKIPKLMARTGDHFRVLLHRLSDGTVEVVGLY